MPPATDSAAELGATIVHDEQEWFVVRIVESTSLFQTSEECYLLDEKYAELRQVQTGEVGFKMFSQIKHQCVQYEDRRGLDPKIWRKF